MIAHADVTIFRLAYQEVLDAYKLTQRTFNWPLVYWAMGAMVVVAIVNTVRYVHKSPLYLEQLLINLLFVAFMIVLSVSFFETIYRIAFLPKRVKKLYGELSALQDEVTLSWRASGPKEQTQRGISEVPWNHFVKRKEDAKMILLYQSDVLFNVVPKRALGKAQLATMRRHMSEIPQKG